MLDEAIVTAGDVMTHDVTVVHPETTLVDAIKLIATRRIGGMPVTDHTGAVVGMLTAGDLVRWHERLTTKRMRWLDMLAAETDLAPSFIEDIRAEKYKVKAVMSPGAITVSEDAPAHDCATLMRTRSIKRVPVVHEGRLIGIVARSDLIRAFAEKLEERRTPAKTVIEKIDEAVRQGREQMVKPRSRPATKTAHP